MNTTIESELRGVASRHLDRASSTQLLSLIEQLIQSPPAIPTSPSESFTFIAEPRFVRLASDGDAWLDTSDGEHVAVRDHLTGLEWSAGTIGEAGWEGAKKLATDCTLLGKNDWRLPTVQELLGLVDYERWDPVVDPEFFRGPYGYTWSSTSRKGPSGYAWDVGLGNGNSGWSGQSSLHRVRAVRAGQSLSLRF